jgi:hypothetical protein
MLLPMDNGRILDTRISNKVGGKGLGFGGPIILALLGKMTHDGLIRIRAVFCSVGIG